MRGISGKKVLRAARTFSTDPVTGKSEDIGFVGKVDGVDVSPILEALEANCIPVVTPLGTGSDGQVYNINADTAASEIAKALRARKLVFVSDVPGVLADRNDESSVIPTICQGAELCRSVEPRYQQSPPDRRQTAPLTAAGNFHHQRCRNPDHPSGFHPITHCAGR